MSQPQVNNETKPPSLCEKPSRSLYQTPVLTVHPFDMITSIMDDPSPVDPGDDGLGRIGFLN